MSTNTLIYYKIIYRGRYDWQIHKAPEVKRGRRMVTVEKALDHLINQLSSRPNEPMRLVFWVTVQHTKTDSNKYCTYLIGSKRFKFKKSYYSANWDKVTTYWREELRQQFREKVALASDKFTIQVLI